MFIENEKVEELQRLCVETRKWIIRMVAASGTGHLGGSFSCVEILVTLYFRQLRVDPANACWLERDRCLLSKGHAGPALYSVLALRGYLPTDELYTLDQPGTRLSKHVDRMKLPACDISAGMLGQGLSIGVGMALGARLTHSPSHVYAILSDGEQQAGQTWEAAMSAAKYRLDNLTAIIDRNKLQVDGPSEEVMPVEPLAAKWRDFGWHVLEVNGHDVGQLLRAYDLALAWKDQPTVIIAHTVKGHGISFTEGKVQWHNKALSKEEARVALAELGEVV
jgi:transketolase